MAAPLDSVNILELSRVTPFHDSITSEFHRPLTLFDAIFIDIAPFEFVFFYRLNESTRSHFDTIIVPRLKHSLSLTLLHYPPVAGHVASTPTSPKPVLSYTRNDSGVSFTVAESSADFDRLAFGGKIPAVELHPFVPRLDSSKEKSDVISLQITLFPNKGFSIGITASHGALDGMSFTLFIKSWTYTCRKISNDLTDKHVPLPEDLKPFYDASLIKDPTGIDMFYLNQWQEETRGSLKISHQLGTIPSDIVRSTFKFTLGDVATLRAKIHAKLDERKKNELHLSTYVVLMAYMSVCLVRCKKESENRYVLMLCVADFRHRLDPPLPATYFGNCVFASARKVKAADIMGEKGIIFAAENLSDAIKHVNSGGVVTKLDYKQMFRSEDGLPLQIIKVGGSPRFKLYDSDFGWGRPELCDMVSVDRSGAISLNDTEDVRGGVQASLALNTKEMEIFTALLADELKNATC